MRTGSRGSILSLIDYEMSPSTLCSDGALSHYSGDVSPSCYYFLLQAEASRHATARAILQCFAMLRRSVHKNILEAQEQFKSN